MTEKFFYGGNTWFARMSTGAVAVWLTSVATDKIEYRINNGSWKTLEVLFLSNNQKSGEGIIRELQADTSYIVELRARAVSDGEWFTSGEYSYKTLKLATIKSIEPSELEIGETLTVNLDNPEGANGFTEYAIVIRSEDHQWLHDASSDYSVGDSFSFDFPSYSNEDIYKYILNTRKGNIPGATSAPFSVRLLERDSYLVEEAESIYKITENESSKPLFSDWSFKDTNSKTVALTGSNQKIIKNYSKLEAKITSANKMVTQKLATPLHYVFAVGSKAVQKAYSTNDLIFNVENPDNEIMSMTAVDSRLFTRKREVNLGNDFIEYAKPTMSININRNDGVDSDTKLTISGTWWNGSFGAVTNTLDLRYRYKKTSASNYGSWVSLTPTINGNSFTFDDYIVGDMGANGFDPSENYDVQIRLRDELENEDNYLLTLRLDNAQPNLALHEDGVAINGPYDDTKGKGLQIYGNEIWFNDILLFYYEDD